VRHVLLVLLLLGCGPGEGATESRAEAQEPREDNFPRGAVGCYRCGVTSVYFRPGDDDPREEEREEATVRLGSVYDLGRSTMVATVEGCPFYITRQPSANTASWVLGPNRCDDVRYHSGFATLRSETVRGEHIFRTQADGEPVDCEPGECDTWEREEWFVTVQLSGQRVWSRTDRSIPTGEHAIHTYDCMRGRCLR
jgi:hypothetical protein